MRWPWPKGEINYLTERSRHVLGDSPATYAAVAALLDVLAEFGDVADPRHGDVTDLRKWAKRQTATRLTRWLIGAEALEVAADQAGWRHGRGDLVLSDRGGPWGPRWHDMRHR